MVAVPDNLFPYSTKEGIARDVLALRATFKSGATRDLQTRREQLLSLRKLLSEGWNELRDALQKDLHRHVFESRMSELAMVDHEIQLHLDFLEDWTKPEKVAGTIASFPGSSFIQRDPLGVVCIIGTWNYPVQLLLQPLVGALSAGNCAVVRLPGDDTCVHTNNALIKLLDQYVDKRFVRYVHGGVDATKDMLSQRFDLIFATGGTMIGKIVAEAAAKTLTPTVLELGGKSPAIIDETCDLEVSARRVAWAAFMNAGQTCVRPDYLVISAKVGDKFVALLEKNIKQFFGENPQESESFVRLINARAFSRVSSLLAQDKPYVTYGGGVDEKDRYIAPTLINFKTDFASFKASACMSQEIFGPILPIYYYESLDDVIEFVTDHEKPLALYAYSTNATTRDRILNETSSGGVCVNDSIMQLSNPNLPFGGVGNSGMGAYHGKYSFDVFSHKKSVMLRSAWLDLKQRYYPYTDSIDKTMSGSLKPITRRMKTTFTYAGYAIGIALLATVAAVIKNNL